MRKVAMIFTVMLVTMSAFNALSQNVVLQPGQQIKLMNNAGNNWSWIGAPLENDGLPDLKFTTSNGFMHLNGYGKLGIGIMNPFGKLEVAGMTYFRGAPTMNTTSEQIRIGRADSNIRYHSIYSHHTTGGKLNFIQFRVHDGVTSATAQKTVMTMFGDGNVGIGTTNTNGYKLAVDGTIGAREIVVNTDTWADFVFAKNYRLMPLSEVENFITENNHLPDVPSEKEVKENGINVAEMNAKLLQKVEELTLYMIQQNKEKEAMAKRITELEKAIEAIK